MCLWLPEAQGLNTVSPVEVEPRTSQFGVRCCTTTSQRSKSTHYENLSMQYTDDFFFSIKIVNLIEKKNVCLKHWLWVDVRTVSVGSFGRMSNSGMRASKITSNLCVWRCSLRKLARLFSSIKIENFIGKKLIFLIFLLKSLIMGIR